MPARGKDGRFKKGKSGAVAKRRKRRSNPAPAAVANPTRRRRRRRRSVTSSGKMVRRRRRRNPDGSSGSLRGFFQFPSVKVLIWSAAANLAIGWAVRRFGGEWGVGLMNQPALSPYGGQGWGARGYMVGAAAVAIGTGLVKKWQGEEAARIFSMAGWQSLIQRFTYTELLARSPWLQETFGQVPEAAQIYDDGDGNRWMRTDQGYVAMQGLVPAGPMGRLVARNPVMGAVAEARPIDRSDNEGYLANQGGGRRYYNGGQRDRMALYDASWGTNWRRAA